MNKNSIRKVAFTLAETLITITIIGIIMALMLRSISRVNPDKDKILFVKSYHTLESAVSNVINDGTKYDQNTDQNADFSQLPLSTALARINGTNYCTMYYVNPASGESGAVCDSSVMDQGNSLCYFLAEQINFIGNFDCQSGSDVVNFVTTNGVCFVGWGGYSGDSHTGRIVTQCQGRTPQNEGYQVKVYKEGKMTVPSGAEGSLQADAYRWIQDQTQIKN